MKKLAVALFVALLGLAFTAPAFAIEHQFGGYWRVRMFNQTDFDGRDNTDGVSVARDQADYTWTVSDPTETGATYGATLKTSDTKYADVQRADTRTRLYYTAVLNDNLKFVNKFEMNAVWGDDTYGDLGADGLSVLVKNSYIDFNYGVANIKLGTQGGVLHRGFIMDDDFSGIVASGNGLTGIYAKVDEEGDAVSDDVQMYHLQYALKANDTLTFTPTLTYVDGAGEDADLWWIGLDIDGSVNAFSYWATLIYNGGEESASVDVEAYLLAAGFGYTLDDMTSLHGQIFYATGDDADDADSQAFRGVSSSYYWAEIMGLGIFDNQASANSCADGISNILAVNFGISYAATEKLTLTGDLWYAMLDEETAASGNEDDLGLEIDVAAKYQLIDGLTVDLVAAYLIAGDATSGNVSDDENPMEIGTRFSISF